jgi:hypothetical protein
MSNVFVVSTAQAGVNRCKAILGYKNLFETSALTGYAQDANYPIELAYDYKTNTEYSPSATSGSVVIVLSQSTANTPNYFGIFSKNANAANLSVQVEVMNIATGLYEIVGTRGSFADGAPQMIYWDGFSSLSQRITIYFDAKVYISAMHIGEAVVFGQTVSVGYQPGQMTSLDSVSNFTTDGNNFVQGRRVTNGNQEKAPINFQRMDWLRTWWPEFMNHALDSKPIFFMANNQNQDYCFYGLQNPSSLTRPDYKSSTFSDLDFEINGWAS